MEKIITIDAAGRLVVPKPMRLELGLREGSRLRVREEAGRRLVLEPVAENAVPVDVDGVLVVRGQLRGKLPDHRTLRQERIRGQASGVG
jgi:AbrB family looped-hinge helix DNA binding protein